MLENNHMKYIVDYIDSKDCFPGVDVNGGICYFLIDNLYSGKCNYTSICKNIQTTSYRDLNEFDIFIRRNEAVSIIHKIKSLNEKTLSSPGGCSPQTPYGLFINI